MNDPRLVDGSASGEGADAGQAPDEALLAPLVAEVAALESSLADAQATVRDAGGRLEEARASEATGDHITVRETDVDAARAAERKISSGLESARATLQALSEKLARLRTLDDAFAAAAAQASAAEARAAEANMKALDAEKRAEQAERLAKGEISGGGFSIRDLKVGALDSRGRYVLHILAESPDQYVVYHAIDEKPASKKSELNQQLKTSRIAVHLSDAPDIMREQAQRLATVSGFRAEVSALIIGPWRNPVFERRFAEALGTTAEFEAEKGRNLMEGLLADLREESLRIGHAWQMFFAAAACIGFVALLYLFSEWIWTPFTESPATNVWAAAKGGAVGALFSSAVLFRERKLAPDNEKIRILLDATVRIGAGVIAGGALLLALSSGFLAKPLGGQADAMTIDNWMYVPVLGFLAGFVERLVPSLFNSVQIQPGPNNAAGPPVGNPGEAAPAGGDRAGGAGRGSVTPPPPGGHGQTSGLPGRTGTSSSGDGKGQS
ncbi:MULTISPECIES: HlyD family secretion protein [Roseomonadaceae]|uniref:Uncharacterized protein n=1 Tax=Falsiroseomonas oleicola TaxID=2801474 RepID=A0ABS6HCR5_9PROT|nr:HlyD family secretion protein [Roseomonas oleicola]MBU8546141.1 hypothetical protein [Roseomonas oleicola]